MDDIPVTEAECICYEGTLKLYGEKECDNIPVTEGVHYKGTLNDGRAFEFIVNERKNTTSIKNRIVSVLLIFLVLIVYEHKKVAEMIYHYYKNNPDAMDAFFGGAMSNSITGLLFGMIVGAL